MYHKILQNLGCISKQQKTGQALRREENKFEFLEKQFHNEKLSFDHKKKTELSLNFLELNKLYNE